MAMLRAGEVTFKDQPLYLVGPRLKPGDRAPDFACVGDGLAMVTLDDTPQIGRMFSVVPSLDTPVCSLQTKKFAEAVDALGDKVACYTVSLDMPFAQGRFCRDAEITSLKNLSDLHDMSFGRHYGVLIAGLSLPLLSRAVFVVDAAGKITYAEYVGKVGDHPDYDAALAALKQVAG